MTSDDTKRDDTPTTLEFTSDKGASRSTWLAALLVLLIVGWMGSGFVLPSEAPAPTVTREAPQPVAVAVATSTAETVTQFYQAEGQALPERDTIRPGDLLFFGSGSKATHVGIYLGDRQMVHAPGRGREVTTTPLDLDYWQQRYLGAVGPAP